MAMFKYDDIDALKFAKHPIVSNWQLGELEAFGSLVWVDGKPELSLRIEIGFGEESPPIRVDHPILQVTKPPAQVTFYAFVPGFGVLTLEHCARHNEKISHNLRRKLSIVTIDFLPQRIWCGANKCESENIIERVTVSDSRLAGFFGSSDLKQIKPASIDENLSLENWQITHPAQRRYQLGKSGYFISYSVTTTQIFSATIETSLSFNTNFSIKNDEICSISDYTVMINYLQNLLSIFCLERFRFEKFTFESKNGPLRLIWQLGAGDDKFRPPMQHQILIDFRNEATCADVFHKWFAPTETEKLSRWLFVRALEETEDGLSRFVGVAQAFEVLGRELGSHVKLSRKERKKASELVAAALSASFAPEFVERASELIRSSNLASFPAVLQNLLQSPAEALEPGSGEKLNDFCKLVAKTRNDVVHMTDNDEGALDRAFAAVNKLSLLLCFWYTLVQAHNLRLSMPDVRSFLFNNRTARHGLPNELLEI